MKTIGYFLWVTFALVGLILVMFGVIGCDVAPVEAKSCVGYLVTSMCNGSIDEATGLPEAGCHDDAGTFVTGCTALAGTVLCVSKCSTPPVVKLSECLIVPPQTLIMHVCSDTCVQCGSEENSGANHMTVEGCFPPGMPGVRCVTNCSQCP